MMDRAEAMVDSWMKLEEIKSAAVKRSKEEASLDPRFHLFAKDKRYVAALKTDTSCSDRTGDLLEAQLSSTCSE